MDEEVLRAAILARVRERGPGKTACPSEVARDLAEDWRPLMAAVRDAAFGLAAEGRLVVTQGGEPVDRTVRGPIRLGLRDP